MSRAELVGQRIAAGELRAGANYSGLNLENELRRRVGSLGLPERQGGMRGATEAEREAFTSFGQGTFRSNAPRWIKNVLGGGGGLGATAAGAAGFGAGVLLSASIRSLLRARRRWMGLGLAKYGNLNALRRAREFELMLLSAIAVGGGRGHSWHTIERAVLARPGDAGDAGRG